MTLDEAIRLLSENVAYRDPDRVIPNPWEFEIIAMLKRSDAHEKSLTLYADKINCIAGIFTDFFDDQHKEP